MAGKIMIRTEKNLQSWKETVAEMLRLAKTYAADLNEFSNYNVYSWFDRMRAVPYGKDDSGSEFLSRPLFLLEDIQAGKPLDCKKKSIMMAALAQLQNIPWRLAVIGEAHSGPDGKKVCDVHHVYPEFKIAKNWIPFDATFPTLSKVGFRLYREDKRFEFYP